MAVGPVDFLGSAKEIAANCQGEIARRNAASRAYYAAYHKSCERIAPDGKDRTAPPVNGNKPRRPGMHKSYILQLEEFAAGSEERKIGVRMARLYALRKVADYKLCDHVSAADVSVQLNNAQDVFNLVGQLNPPPSGNSATPPVSPQPASPSPNGATPASSKPKLKVVK